MDLPTIKRLNNTMYRHTAVLDTASNYLDLPAHFLAHSVLPSVAGATLPLSLPWVLPSPPLLKFSPTLVLPRPPSPYFPMSAPYHGMQPTCSPSIVLPETDPLLNNKLVEDADSHCLIGAWSGSLNLVWDTVEGKPQLVELPAVVEIYPDLNVESAVNEFGYLLRSKVVVGDFDMTTGTGIGAGTCEAFFDVTCQESASRTAFAAKRDLSE